MQTKIHCLIVTLIISTSSLFAQIELEFTDTISTPVTDLLDIAVHNTVTNSLPEQKTLRWVRTEVDITSGWETFMCDKVGCHSPSVDSSEINLESNASSILDLHLRTNGIYEGYAFVEVKILHVDDPSVFNFVYLIFNSSITTSTNDLESFTFKVYPNPSRGLFTIEEPSNEVSSVKVLNMAGQELHHLVIGEQRWMNLSQLAQGTYLVQLLDKEGIVLGSKLISKY